MKKTTKCINPITLKETYIEVPCGSCVNCKKRRVSGWSFRLQQQARVSKCAWFVTFTYTTDTVPISSKGRMTLEKRDVQLFLKRLRKKQSSKISYYLCGEYGTEKYRPHYHAIMFNVELKNLIGEVMATKAILNKETMLTGKTQIICPLWYKELDNGEKVTMGHVTIGQVSPASIGYVLEYISKKERIPQYQGDDRVPEFSLMSKGIGKNYVNEDSKKWHHADMLNRYYAPLHENKKAPLPRYLAKLLYKDEERQAIGIYLKDKEFDEYMTLTEKEKLQKLQSFTAFREILLNEANKEKRSLKY